MGESILRPRRNPKEFLVVTGQVVERESGQYSRTGTPAAPPRKGRGVAVTRANPETPAVAPERVVFSF